MIPLRILDQRGTQIGCWTLAIKSEDGFGTHRMRPAGFVSAQCGDAAEDSSSFEVDLPPSFHAVREVFVDLTSITSMQHSRFAHNLAGALGLSVDERWPLLYRPTMLGATIRLYRSAGDDLLPEGYIHQLREQELSPEVDQLIANLQHRIEAIAREYVDGYDFANKYGVSAIVTVGSTSRKTYATRRCDFDLLINTNTRQAEIPRTDIRRVVSHLTSKLQETTQFKEYVDLVRLEESGLRASLVESFFGVRGKESFVARFDLQTEVSCFNMLDITFGRIPQLLGYEIWIQRFLRKLSDDDRSRFRTEVGLAKKLFSLMGNLYGPGIAGFRGNVIEQFIIQGRDYRYTSAQGGTLANSLRLIAEEAGAGGGTIPFYDYKARFPLWHPGWWEKEVGFGVDQPGVNILDLLGNGDQILAAAQWSRLQSLAKAHVESCDMGQSWSTERVVREARRRLGEEV